FDHVRFIIVLPYEDAVATVVVGQAILEGPQAMDKLGPLESAGVHVALDTHGDTSDGGVPLERPQVESRQPIARERRLRLHERGNAPAPRDAIREGIGLEVRRRWIPPIGMLEGVVTDAVAE